MIQTLKCDSSTKADKYDCGEWDYIWDAMLYVPIDDTVEVFKLGSFVTPYGKRLKMGGHKGWEWVYDLTDYAPILSGKKVGKDLKVIKKPKSVIDFIKNGTKSKNPE